MDEHLAVDFGRVAKELSLRPEQIVSVVELLDGGNTVPFITRYRKERTGNLDEEQIRAIQDRVGCLRQLVERASTIVRLIDAQGKLTPELRTSIERADSLKRLEDLYLPFRPKRKSRADLARQRGLAPLAERIWNSDATISDLPTAAAAHVSPENGMPTPDDVLQGAADILSERIAEDAEIRAAARKVAWATGRLTVSATKEGHDQGREYRDYFNFSEGVERIPPHRTMALNRGEKAGALRVKFEWDEPGVTRQVRGLLQLDRHRFDLFVSGCAADALTRLIQPSMEREIRRELTDAAERHAVEVFARNLRNLLLQPPVRGQRIVAIDPGFRTGCKTAALDELGNCLAEDVVYVTGSGEKLDAEKQKLADLLRTHECRLVVIGNGTACRECEELVAGMIRDLLPDARYQIVNEAGASIYSTSQVARDEFPEFDATVRGTVSIGRRVLDPLSELVKIDPQHIGVGMYQHDVSPRLLKESLDGVVESCVNFVGVDANTASASLLRHVSGFNQLIARRVVAWRQDHGRFANRRQLLGVPGIGEATFTQAAGFLKILGGDEPLDATWIHPESYAVARQILERAGLVSEGQVGGSCDAAEYQDRLRGVDAPSAARDLDIGALTFRDVLEDLMRPGRDPRIDLPGPIFKQGILKLDDLAPGVELRGTVLNVVDFGVFVDVGLKDSGLVHISQLSTRFVRSPHDVASVGDVVTVWVLAIDAERRRVSLTMIPPNARRTPDSTATAREVDKPAAREPAIVPPPPAAAARSDRDRGDRPKRRAKGAAHRAAVPVAKTQRGESPLDEQTLRGFDELKALWNRHAK